MLSVSIPHHSLLSSYLLAPYELFCEVNHRYMFIPCFFFLQTLLINMLPFVSFQFSRKSIKSCFNINPLTWKIVINIYCMLIFDLCLGYREWICVFQWLGGVNIYDNLKLSWPCERHVHCSFTLVDLYRCESGA